MEGRREGRDESSIEWSNIIIGTTKPQETWGNRFHNQYAR